MSSRKCAISKITWMEHGPRWTNDKIDYKIHIHSSFCIMLKSETICRLCRDSEEYRASHKLHHDILIRMVFLWVGCARQTIQCLLVSLYAIDIIRIIIRRQFAFWLAYKWERCCHCNLNMFGVLHNVSRTGFVCWQIWAFGAASTFKFWFVPFFAPARECLCVCVCVSVFVCDGSIVYSNTVRLSHFANKYVDLSWPLVDWQNQHRQYLCKNNSGNIDLLWSSDCLGRKKNRFSNNPGAFALEYYS